MYQEYTSADTSINSSKVPAVFSLVEFRSGTTNLDYGGGKFDTAAEALKEKGVRNLILDPYNRTRNHNDMVINVLERRKADTATCSNVLNVIKEEDVRRDVLQNIALFVKRGGEVYITVYEGDGSGVGRPTAKGYQLNRKLEGYLKEIRQIFPDAIKRGKVIVAHNHA